MKQVISIVIYVVNILNKVLTVDLGLLIDKK